ncbi:MAG: hypothetical protein Q4P78_08805, partial [Rothia sp. (in: high G+C Gram-positive bacteria)]|uniref:hypothetical protein n=1 Tax=Rothia sp. (in: high G+C Gram-positive bacteria) TaxID=1885016 RepID=UPI0026DED563
MSNAQEAPNLLDVARGDSVFNPTTGRFESGQHEFEDAQQKEREQKLKDAYKERDRLNKELDRRGREIDAKAYASYTPNAGITGSLGLGEAVAQISARNADKEYQTLAASAAANDRYIRAMEAMRDKAGFWRALGGTFNAQNWDFGLTDIHTAGRLAAIKKKIDNKQELTEEEKALFDKSVAANEAEASASAELGSLYRMGNIAGQSLPYAVDFMLSAGTSAIPRTIASASAHGLARAGASSLARVTAKAAEHGLTGLGARAGAKMAAKAAERGITNKAAQWVMRNTGVAAGDLAKAAAISNTVQAGKTTADIINRHTGRPEYSDKGGRTFTDGESLGEAIYKGEASSIIENYTEMLGEHLPGVRPVLENGLAKVGLKRASDWVARVAESDFNKFAQKWLKKAGVNGVGGEIMEEEINIPLNAVFVGDQKM